MKRAVAILLLIAASLQAIRQVAGGVPESAGTAERQAVARRLDATLDLAGKMLTLERLDEARKLYREALALRPDDVDVAAALLEVERRRGDDEAQLPLFDRVLATRPRDRELLLARAGCLWRLGRKTEALKVWHALPLQFPGDEAVLNELTEVYLGIDRFDDVADVLRTRRERFGEDASLRLDESRLRLARDEPDKALKLLIRASDLEIENDALRDSVESLLLTVARRTNRTEDVVTHLRDRIDDCDVRIAERLAILADEAADRKAFADAIRLAEEAVRHLTDEKARQAISEKIAAWRKE